ncbi:hypothetical protein [Alcanivorax sp.]|uniref:hypothetical protein n=1 Tax=Alcanivorax sp. TaxID=1872427 RepID=UPI0025C4FEB9|nr:hypothetical protein [Alcanivorax sp.]
MLKWVYGVLIAAFVAMVVGGAVSKANDAWQAQQRAITMMQESQQQQRQKVDEIRDRIARTQAQPTLSDHDRWLIAHLQKTLGRLDTVVDGQQTHSAQLYRGLLRTWVGYAFLGIAMVVLAFCLLVRPSKALTREEKQWLASNPRDIPGLLLDPGAYRNTAAPVRGGSNFVTARIKPVKAGLLRITRSRALTGMGLAFIIAPQGGLAVELYYIADALFVSHIPFSQMTWGGTMQAFTLAGLFVLFSTTSNARLDRRQQTITLPGDNRTLAFNEVESVQLNQVLTTGERSFVNSQIQLNLHNGESLSLLSHGGKEQIYVDLIRTALFLDKPAVIPEA